MTTTRRDAWRPLPGGVATAALTALIFLASACSDSSPATANTPDTSVAPGTSVDSSVTTVADAEPISVEDSDHEPSDVIEVDVGQLLTDAIEAVGTRYEFATSVGMLGETLTRVSGRLYDDSSAYLITTSGSELEYVITPEGRWARDPGGDWVTLQENPPLADPLSMLTAPKAIEILAVDGATVTIAAAYGGVALGFPDTEQITVEMVIAGSRLRSLRYSTEAGGDVATVETEISSKLNIEPVTAPA